MNAKLTDARAKAILRRWPNKTNAWAGRDQETFLRAQPKETDSLAVAPLLRNAGEQALRSQPDGLWVSLAGTRYADLIVVEACGTLQNLNDKRARYMPTGTALMLDCRRRWFSEEIRLPNGGRRTRISQLGLEENPGDCLIPVRSLRVLFALPRGTYAAYRSGGAPAPHEFYCEQTSLGAFNGQPMQKLFKRMRLDAHFLTRR